MWYILVFLTIGIVSIYFLFVWSKVIITFLLLHHQDQDYIKIEVRFLRYLRYKKEIPLVAIDKEHMAIKTKEQTSTEGKTAEHEKSYTPKELIHQLQEVRQFVQNVVGLHTIVSRFLSNVTIHTLQWKTEFGTSDASNTGMICGIMWSIKGTVVGILSHFMELNTKPSVQIIPSFQEKHSQTRLECMISFRFGKAIVALFQIARHTRGRIPKWSKNIA
ncbi:DUF2953 domain-containing protein [Pontibacillus litoralis]|uniref:DUF2953 domain-containing protein n=1 Tax=Pontibacillus litoralis JSM 072002 TaxID=1385512 RepID=A0A0A5GDC5_9BACI|nr:DUF2953 domain-containing protein [Pontibacillus litoralis]KGX89213.1 hypothetical protein N784_02020 [Pontibacillus litoralis JSM 072002]